MYQVFGKKYRYEFPFVNFETRNKQKALDELNLHTIKKYTLADMPKKDEEKHYISKYPDCRWIFVTNFKKS